MVSVAPNAISARYDGALSIPNFPFFNSIPVRNVETAVAAAEEISVGNGYHNTFLPVGCDSDNAFVTRCINGFCFVDEYAASFQDSPIHVARHRYAVTPATHDRIVDVLPVLFPANIGVRQIIECERSASAGAARR